MGKYDQISGERLQAELTRFSRWVIRLEDEGRLLGRTGDVLQFLGELRQMVFAYSVRSVTGAEPDDSDRGSPGTGTQE